MQGNGGAIGNVRGVLSSLSVSLNFTGLDIGLVMQHSVMEYQGLG